MPPHIATGTLNQNLDPAVSDESVRHGATDAAYRLDDYSSMKPMADLPAAESDHPWQKFGLSPNEVLVLHLMLEAYTESAISHRLRIPLRNVHSHCRFALFQV
jgi:DNA-binding NarL/FixJ family response regulator